MISDEILNALARALLVICPPLTAHALLRRVGRFFPQRHDRRAVLEAAHSLRARGTCLSRALALASTAPSADVVIGVHSGRGEAFGAHAWVEIDGQPLAEDDPQGHEIVRFRGVDPGRATLERRR